MHVFGSNELRAEVLGRGLCVGCGACVGLCPYFRNHHGQTVMLFDCTLGQGRCHAFCPKAELDLDELARLTWGRPYGGEDLGNYLTLTASQAGMRAASGPVQAGGTVTALVACALESGLIPGAVLTAREGLASMPRLVSTPEAAALCAGSKYLASPTLAALNHAARAGSRGLGVVGTPCQVLALAKMRTNPLNDGDYIDPAGLVIGLFCTWALDTRRSMPLLRRVLGGAKLKGMDIPPPPAERLLLKTDQGEIAVGLDEVRPLIPHGCEICPDMTAEFADLSVGVSEGREGWNTLIVRTPRGQDLVERALRDGYLVCEPLPPGEEEHLREASRGKKRRALRAAADEGLLKDAGDGRHAALRLPEDIARRLMANPQEAT